MNGMKFTINNEDKIEALLTVGKYLGNKKMTDLVNKSETIMLWRETNKIRTVLEKHEARCNNLEMFDKYYSFLRILQHLNDYLYDCMRDVTKATDL